MNSFTFNKYVANLAVYKYIMDIACVNSQL